MRAGGAKQTYSELVSSGIVDSPILRYGYVLPLVVQLWPCAPCEG
jgi:hypothetical protein